MIALGQGMHDPERTTDLTSDIAFKSGIKEQFETIQGAFWAEGEGILRTSLEFLQWEIKPHLRY
jgi:hypothetical protein